MKGAGTVDLLAINVITLSQAEKFYENLGYKRVNNKIYLEAGIQHIDMEKTIS